MLTQSNDSKIITKLMLRLLPIQILMAAVGMINGTITSLFASNYIGAEAMGAVGLYAPILQLTGALNTMLVGGSQILCARYIGKNQREHTGKVFTLDLLLTIGFSAVVIIVLLILSVFNLTGILGANEQMRPLLNVYIIGQAIGILPKMLSAHLSAYLSLENQRRRTMIASIVYIGANFVLVYLFVAGLQMGVWGLSLASSLGQWIFFLIQAEYYLKGRSAFRFRWKDCDLKEAGEIVKIGIPGSLSQGYQTIRRFIVNALVIFYVGNIGLSAFSTVEAFLGFFWAVPAGMLAVSRMLMGISIGEEDRKTLTNIMKTVLFCFIPLVLVISILLSLFADPLTRLYYQDPSQTIYRMVRWGFRIRSLSLPLSCACIHFVCYGQNSGKQALVHILSLLDGVVCNSLFAALLLPLIGIRGMFLAEVLNGAVTTITFLAYSVIKNRRLPRNVEDLLVLPENFGVSEENRMDLSIRSMDEVIMVSQEIGNFCRDHGLDVRRSFFAALAMEEMAGNVVTHGFPKDKAKHTVDVRVSIKDDDLILRIKDDCIKFDPVQFEKILDPEDQASNIGIRMILRISKSTDYQNILGLNVLTVRI